MRSEAEIRHVIDLLTKIKLETNGARVYEREIEWLLWVLSEPATPGEPAQQSLRVALEQCVQAIMEWGHGNESLLEAAQRVAEVALEQAQPDKERDYLAGFDEIVGSNKSQADTKTLLNRRYGED